MFEGFLLQASYRLQTGTPVVQLFGRLADGRPFQVEDDRARPYFFVREADAERLRGEARATLTSTPLCSLAGEPLARVGVRVPSDVAALRERLEREGLPSFEADLPFATRFLIDAGVRSAVAIEGEPETRGGLVHFSNPTLHPGRERPALRVLSLDFETDPEAREVRSLALVGDGIDEVHLVRTGDSDEVEGAEVHPDEASLLETAAARVRELDPDLLTGWNLVDFDLQLWARRAGELGLDLELGRAPGELRFLRDAGYNRSQRASLPGRAVLDALPLARDALKLPDYRLETVAQQVLGRGKRIDQDAPDKGAEIDRLYREDPEALVAYNREDARLVLDILEREGLLELCIERSLLSGMPLDRVGASIASFDRLYLPELRRRGAVAPSVDPDRQSRPVRGGAVLDSVPGLFRNVAVFDFKSLYPSLIRSFQLDPLAHARAGDDAIEAPGGARFAREGAILPAILERFTARREAAKQRGDRHADQALKIMMNALFGVLAAPSCRFFDPAIANAITGFGQETLHRTRDAFAEQGVEVIYGDTDSVFVQLEAGEPEAAAREAEALRKAVQDRVLGELRERHRVEPHLDLELERIFERFFMPRVRGGKSGSKKRYAGLHRGRLELVGLEAVRRDWPAVAGRLQRGLLERVFADEPVAPFVGETLAALRRGELDAELVYAKRVRKGSLDRYTAATPPHVQAARKAGPRAGPTVRYVVTQAGPEPVFHGEPLPGEIDRAHYVERVLRPIAESILEAVGEHVEDAFGEPRQLGLL